MRRTLLAAFTASAFLALGATTSEAADRNATDPPEVTVAGTFREDGFTVSFASDNGHHELELAITKGKQFAVYTVPAKVDRRSLRASFGALGSLDLRFKPPDEPPTGCPAYGSPVQRRLTGSFDFTGERGYLKIRRSSVGARVIAVPSPACEEEKPRRAQASRAGILLEAEATLTASTPDGQRIRYLFAGGRREGSDVEADVFGGLIQYRGAMRVQRGGEAAGDADVFNWDSEQGTATVAPAAPFTGSADFFRRPGESPLLSGDLQVAILGGDPVPLTGPDFTEVTFRPRLYD